MFPRKIISQLYYFTTMCIDIDMECAMSLYSTGTVARRMVEHTRTSIYPSSLISNLPSLILHLSQQQSFLARITLLLYLYLYLSLYRACTHRLLWVCPIISYHTLVLRSHRCSYQEAFHLATMGGAEILGLQKVIGNFLPGKQVRCSLVN